MKHWLSISSSLVLCLALAARAEPFALDKSSKITITVGPSTSVDLYAKAGAQGATLDYYYAPSRLRVSAGPRQEPQLTILTYISDGSEGASGGTFNALVTWGLTAAEERAVEQKLRQAKPNARLRGAAPLETVEEGPSVSVLTALGGDEEIAWSGVAPLQPGGRAAIAANLTPTGAALLDAGIAEGNLAGITVEMNFLLPFRADLGECRVTIDWDEINSELTTLSYDDIYRESGVLWWHEDERHQSERLVTVQWAMSEGHIENTCNYDRANQEQQEFFERAIASFLTAKLGATEEAKAAADAAAEEAGEDDDGEESDGPANPGVDRYYYRYSKRLFSRFTGREVLEIKRSFVVRDPLPAVIGNVKEWVSGLDGHPGVRIKSVDLSSTEFNQVPVTFSLGQKAIEMFGLNDGVEAALNSVTVTLRKARARGSEFRDYHVFTAAEVAAGAFDHVFEYARGSSAEPFEYDYAVTWSFVGTRGEEGPFQETSVAAHTLEPDARGSKIIFRANPSALEDGRIMGATAEVKYRFLGREKTGYVNVFAGEDPQDEMVLFVDNDARHIAVRTVYTHEIHGQLATPWEAKTVPSSGAMPIFAVLPDALLEEEPSFLEQAKSAVEAAAERALDDVLEEYGKL